VGIEIVDSVRITSFVENKNIGIDLDRKRNLCMFGSLTSIDPFHLPVKSFALQLIGRMHSLCRLKIRDRGRFRFFIRWHTICLAELSNKKGKEKTEC